MRIVIVCSRLCFGGAERVAVLWANGFHRNGYEVVMVSNLFDPVTYQLDDGIVIEKLVSVNQNKFKKWLSSFVNVRRVLKKYNPDVIIGVLATCSFISWVASFGLHIPVIATEHDSFERPASAPFGFWNKFSKFYLNKLYKHVTVLTYADKKVIGKRLKHVNAMPNPLSLSPLENIPQKQNVVLAIGRLDAWHYKGFDVLIKAWGKLNESSKVTESRSKFNIKIEREGWKLQIAGTGSEESLNYLKQLCKENGVENTVEFLGFRKDVEKLYQEVSIFVLSSRYEGFGLVLIEAMSQGCACIACDYKGRQREIMSPTLTLPSREGERPLGSRSFGTRNLNSETQNQIVEACDNGILCEPDNVDALAEAMAKMITDNEYRESVRMNAIGRSKFYAIESTIDRWDLLIKDLI